MEDSTLTTERIFCFVCKVTYPLGDSHLAFTSFLALTCKHDFEMCTDHIPSERVCSYCGMIEPEAL